MCVLLALVLSILAAPISALAQPVTVEDRDTEASAHFQKGVELYQEGSLDAALVEFERAYELVPNYKLLFNLAQVQAERHEYVIALDFFQNYLDQGGRDISEQRRVQVEQEMRRLRDRLAELWVETNVEDAQLYVNDELVGELPLEKRVIINSGICRVRVEKPGYRAATHEFKVAGGDKPRLNLPLVKEEKAITVIQKDSGSPAYAPPRPNRAPFWISAAATGILGGATATFAILASGADDDLETELNHFPGDAEAIDDARTRLRTYAALTDGFAAGTIVAAGAAIYFLVSPPMTSGPERVAKSGVQVHVIPHPTGASVLGQF